MSPRDRNNPRSPMEFHPLGEAARYLDAKAEEIGVKDTVIELGLDVADVVYLAQQRAIRVVMVQTGRVRELQVMYATNRPAPVAFDRVESEMIEQFTLAILDAIVIGWKGHEIKTRNAEKGE